MRTNNRLILLAVQLRRGLVQDDEAGAIGEGAGDLDQLPRLDAEVAGAHVLRHGDIPAVEQLARLAAQRRPRDEAALCRLAVDEQVLRDGQVGDDGRMLVDAGDALAPALAVEIGGAGSPEKRTSPVSEARRPVRMPTSVDLPAPLRPTRA